MSKIPDDPKFIWLKYLRANKTSSAYKEYLKSPHWVNYRKKRLKNTECAVCCKPAVQLHHKNYSLLGMRQDEHIVPLCKMDHYAISSRGSYIKRGYQYSDEEVIEILKEKGYLK